MSSSSVVTASVSKKYYFIIFKKTFIKLGDARPLVDVRAWLAGKFTYEDWKKELDVKDSKRIMAKYFQRWRNHMQV